MLSTDGRRLLVHRRATTKDLRPGWWDVCAGGVLSVGETYLEAARREVAEEIGLTDVTPLFLGTGRCDTDDSRELSHLYLVHHDGPFTFADGEVDEARFVDRRELRAAMSTERFLPSCAAMVLPLVPGFDV